MTRPTRCGPASSSPNQPACFPWCTRPARRCDKDHRVPYDAGGAPCDCNPILGQLPVARSVRHQPHADVRALGAQFRCPRGHWVSGPRQRQNGCPAGSAYTWKTSPEVAGSSAGFNSLAPSEIALSCAAEKSSTHTSRWICCCCGPPGHSGATWLGASWIPSRQSPSTLTLCQSSSASTVPSRSPAQKALSACKSGASRTWINRETRMTPMVSHSQGPREDSMFPLRPHMPQMARRALVRALAPKTLGATGARSLQGPSLRSGVGPSVVVPGASAS